MRTRRDVVGTLQLPSGRVSVDMAGYLVNPDICSREFAEMVPDLGGIIPGSPAMACHVRLARRPGTSRDHG